MYKRDFVTDKTYIHRDSKKMLSRIVQASPPLFQALFIGIFSVVNSIISIIHNPRDHPRLRGKYSSMRVDGFSRQGSPPLTREIHIKFFACQEFCGITPAYAGNTLPP